MAPPFKLSKDNIELQFATNHFGHFLLTNLLMDTMKKTASKTKKEERIVNVASEAHRLSYKEGIRFDKINNEEEYKRWSAYGQSKLANVLHANELARRLKVLISAPEDINPRGLEFYFGINKGDLARCSVKYWLRWVELDWHSHMNQFSFPIPFKQVSRLYFKSFAINLLTLLTWYCFSLDSLQHP